MRLAIIRDGIEDYEAFAVLEELTEELERSGKDEKLVEKNRVMLQVPPEVTKDLRNYTNDPLVLLKHRARLATQIVNTRRGTWGPAHQRLTCTNDLPPENQPMNCERLHGSRTHCGKGTDMARKRSQAEEIIRKLRAIEVHMAKGLKAEEAARREEIAEQTYYRWRREYGGLKIDPGQAIEGTGTGECQSQEAFGRGPPRQGDATVTCPPTSCTNIDVSSPRCSMGC